MEEQKNINKSNKRVAMIILSIAAILIVSVLVMVAIEKDSIQDVSQNSDYILLEPEQGDYSIELPKGWEYEVFVPESDQGYSMVCTNQELQSSILVLATPKDDSQTVDDLVDAIGGIYSAFGVDPIRREEVTINGADGIEYQMVVGDKNIGEFYQLGFVTIGDNFNFSLIIQSTVEVVDQMEPTFDYVINSFELK